MSYGGPLPFGQRLRAAIWPAVRFAILCAAVFLVAIGYGLFARAFAPLPRSATALAVLALPPAATAGVLAFAIDVLLPRTGRIARGALMAVTLAAAAPLASAAVFSLQFRSNYPAEYPPVWTQDGFHNLVWTGVATLYMFAVTGTRLFLPLGPVALGLVAVWFALRSGPATARTAN